MDAASILEQQLQDATSVGQIEAIARRAISAIRSTESERDWYRERVVWGHYEDVVPHYVQGIAGEHEINEPVTAHQVRNLYKAIDVYAHERERFRHSKPEITGAYFLAGGHGEVDSNYLPQFVRICPAYGAAWEQLYERTERTVTYEGS